MAAGVRVGSVRLCRSRRGTIRRSAPRAREIEAGIWCPFTGGAAVADDFDGFLDFIWWWMTAPRSPPACRKRTGRIPGCATVRLYAPRRRGSTLPNIVEEAVGYVPYDRSPRHRSPAFRPATSGAGLGYRGYRNLASPTSTTRSSRAPIGGTEGNTPPTASRFEVQSRLRCLRYPRAHLPACARDREHPADGAWIAELIDRGHACVRWRLVRRLLTWHPGQSTAKFSPTVKAG
jgi:hypothetical protein